MHPGNFYLIFIKALVAPFCSEDSFLGSLLIGQYGILTMTPYYLFGLLLPLVAGFYLLQHVLDESRLFPRIAGWLNKPFHLLGPERKRHYPAYPGLRLCDRGPGIHLHSRHQKGTPHRFRAALYRDSLLRPGRNHIFLCFPSRAEVFSVLPVRNLLCFFSSLERC